jgi:hypothetical protein
MWRWHAWRHLLNGCVGGLLDVNCFGPDVFLDCSGTFVVHYVQCWMVAAGFHYGDDFGDYLYHGSNGARRHGPDDDCIEAIDVGNKHVLHTFEGSDQEGASDVCIHGARYGIGKCGKAEHILHSTYFLSGKHAINLGTRSIMLDCMLRGEAVLAWCHCMCPLSIAVECGRWFLLMLY